jgi:hypothetical protein
MTHLELNEAAWPELAVRLPASLDLEASARAYKALQRPRGVRSGSDLLRLALSYVMGLSLRGTAAWAELAAVARLSDVALLNRLRKAADWLGAIVASILAERMTLPVACSAPLHVRLIDATMLTAPGGAQWRLHVSYDLAGQRIADVTLTTDDEAESLRRFACTAGEVAVADRGYAKTGDLARWRAQEGDFIVRTGWNALRLCTPQGTPFDLAGVFERLPEHGIADVAVAVALDRACTRLLPLRLVVLALGAGDAERNRRRARRRAKKQGKRIQPMTLRAAGFVLLLTSLDSARCAAHDVLELYRLRWQIELAFKRLKSIVHLDGLPAKDPDLVRSWIYAKLIVALLLEDTTRVALDSPPCAEPCKTTQRLALAHPAATA